MKLEDQVCSRAQGARLQELGVNGDCAAFAWCFIGVADVGGHFAPVYKHEETNADTKLLCPAFTVGELGLLLDCDSSGTPLNYNDDLCKAIDEFAKECKTEADLRARLLIKGLEIGFFNVDDVNARISAT